LAPRLKPGCLVTDAGSSKAAIVAGVESLPLAQAAFVGGHPMTGSEQMGVEHARADLFERTTYAITPTPSTAPWATDRLRDLAVALGACPLVLDPEEHDRAVAAVSHLPHLLATTLVLLTEQRARRGEPVYELAAGSWDSGTRVAASGSRLWREIYVSNREAVLAAVDDFRDTLSLLRELLAHDPGDALEVLLEEARRHKENPIRRCHDD
jgi:prephenate dehydrogenase